MNKVQYLLIPGMFLLAAASAHGKTLLVEGNLASRLQLDQRMTFSVEKPLKTLFFRFALPSRFANRSVSQEISDLDIRYQPLPSIVEDEHDRFGNRFRKVTWSDVKEDVRVTVSFQAKVASELSAMESTSAFPLKQIPEAERMYLKSSSMVQSEDPEITSLAGRLTASAASQYEAVTAVLNHVSDNVKYSYNPPQYDALYTLKSQSGNCQNFAHLSMALLRAAGIPARIVGGISLKEPWKVPTGSDTSLVQKMGQGGHAWMEIYFPDLGWLSYDPQQSKQFTSTRHIKQTHGMDSRDINDTWRGKPFLPAYGELIEARYLEDKVALDLKSASPAPRAYVISNSVRTAAIPAPAVPPPVVITPPAPIKPVPAKPQKIEEVVEFGNMQFPTFVDLYSIAGETGVKILDKETSEYVTSRHVYAQAVHVAFPLTVDRVSLAMHKFGGDGTVYVDLVADADGKPGFSGIRSLPVFVENISRKPGYYWVDFSFDKNDPRTRLLPGKYWIVFRRSGEAILTWFYIPGKPYSGSDDTRSTARGHTWEDILSYDFVFKVLGRTNVVGDSTVDGRGGN